MNTALSSRGAFGSSNETGGGNSMSGWVTSSGNSESFGVGASKSHTANSQQYRPPSAASRFANFADDVVGGASLMNDDAAGSGVFPFRTVNSGQFDVAKSSSSNAQQRATLTNAMLMNANSSLTQPSAPNSSISSFASATSAFGSYVPPFGSSGSTSVIGNNRIGGASSSTNGGTPPPTLGGGSAQSMALQNNQLSQLAALTNAARAASVSSQNGPVSSSNALFGNVTSRSATTTGGQSGVSTWMSLSGSGSSSTGGLLGNPQTLSLSQSQQAAAAAAASSQSSALFRAASAFQAGGSSTPTSSTNMQMLVNQFMMNQNASGEVMSTSGSTLKDAPPALLDPSAFPSLVPSASRATPPLLNGPTQTSMSAAQSGAVSLPLAAFGNPVGPVGGARTYVSAALGGRSGAGDGHAAAQEFSIQPDDFPALPATVTRSNNGASSGSSSAGVNVAQLSAAFSSSMQLGGPNSSGGMFAAAAAFSNNGQETSRSTSAIGGNVGVNVQSNNSMLSAQAGNVMRGGGARAQSGAGAGAGGLNSQVADGTIQLPASIIPDHFGMLGILSFLKAAEQDQEAVQLASGIDLTSLGVNVTASDQLFTSFASPWADTPAKPQDIDWPVPTEYITSPFMRDKFPMPSMNRYPDEQLFFIFYVMVGDAQQLLAATELYNRDWRFHKEERVWITRIPSIDPLQKTNAFERGTYYYFDVTKWTRVAKEMVIEYEKLEEKPQLAHLAPQHTMMTAAANMAASVHQQKLAAGAGAAAALSQSHAQTPLGAANLNVSSAMVSQHLAAAAAAVSGSQAANTQSQQPIAAFGNMSALAALKQPHASLGGNVGHLSGGVANAPNGMFSVPSLN